MNFEIKQHEYGYFSVCNLPTQEALEIYYSNKYYQDESVQYAHTYSTEELRYFLINPKIAEYVFHDKYTIAKNSLLDVGTGEGFFANYFYQNGWEVSTLDYSINGIQRHNPALVPTLMQGDVFKSLETLTDNNRTFNLINLSNVLEHVIDPIKLLEQLKSLLNEQSLLRISVPNDYSNFQTFLLKKGYTTNTWLCPPDHLHYFTFESLGNLLRALDYEIVLSMGEFPIELFLSNAASNYIKNREHGKYAHQSRIEVSNFLFDQGIDQYIDYYKASANIGLSRQVVIFARKKENDETRTF